MTIAVLKEELLRAASLSAKNGDGYAARSFVRAWLELNERVSEEEPDGKSDATPGAPPR